MDNKRLFDSVSLSNILSFGEGSNTIILKNLNVLVGPNGSGKSNFLEAFRLFQYAPTDFAKPISVSGGINNWLWKGTADEKIASLQCFVFSHSGKWLHYLIIFTDVGNGRVAITREGLFEEPENADADPTTLIDHKGSEVVLASRNINADPFVENEWGYQNLSRFDFPFDKSLLSQRNDPYAYPQLTFLASVFKQIFMYTDATFGRTTFARLPQDAALDSTFLFPDASNLALVLNDLQNQPPVMKTIIEKLKLFYERAENIITRVQGGTVQIYFQEEGLTATVPASRLSDGTLRYLCLLVILCHPSPPPLICIEEPELGMHPDVLPTIAELLIEASQRTQLIVTTHSDLLVSAIGGKHPEAIVVCEKGDNGTTMKRLEADKMKEWLTRYSLGDLWLKGEIGGTRW